MDSYLELNYDEMVKTNWGGFAYDVGFAVRSLGRIVLEGPIGVIKAGAEASVLYN